MSDAITRYQFIPWLRQGLSSEIQPLPATAPGTATPAVQRAAINVRLVINNKTGSNETITKDVSLYGPGDVVGFDKSLVVRTDPKNNVGDFEPNYFPFVEFWEEDLPWVITPLPSRVMIGETEQNVKNLMPWITLIVLKTGKNPKDKDDSTGEYYDPLVPDISKPTPYITVKTINTSLPDLSHAWRWAHVQLTTDQAQLPPDSEEIGESFMKASIRDYPERSVSRLICPRLLEPGTLYDAFVVPVFKSGLKAGLGEDVSPVRLDELAWDKDGTDFIDLPYYYRWQFRTGLRGDFEYLVRLLKPVPLDDRVGKRNIDCSDPGFEITLPADPDKPELYVLGLEGALRHPDATTSPCPGTLGDELNRAINLAPQLESGTVPDGMSNEPRVGPPIYGMYHAGIKSVTTASWEWIKQLNLDPRFRTIANFGTEVIQKNQENLVHEAWKQIGAVDEANRKLREAELAEATAKKMLEKKILALPKNTVIGLTAPVHSKIASPDSTAINRRSVKGSLAESAIPKVAFDPGFRKTFRRRGAARRRQKSVPARTDLLDRMNDGSVRGAGPVPKADGSMSIGDISENLRPGWSKGFFWSFMKVLPVVLLVLLALLVATFTVLKFLNVTDFILNPIQIAIDAVLLALSLLVSKLNVPGNMADNVKEENITADLVQKASPPPDFPNASDFKAFATIMQGFLNTTPSPRPVKPKANLEAIHAKLALELDPAKTIRKKMRTLILFGKWKRTGLERIMASPEFPQPMYEPLRDLSQDLLLPGLEYVSQNSITLIETNSAFVNSYMAGLNVEFASELLWREYPTDQRCTPFRQFWDAAETVMQPAKEQELRTLVVTERKAELDAITDANEKDKLIAKYIEEKWRESLRDIKPIHKWKNTRLDTRITDMGGSAIDKTTDAGGENENLVLLVRGDLLKKYPTALIFAVKAEWVEETKNGALQYVRKPDFSELGNDDDEDTIKYPIFKGSLKPDITFFGFDLGEDEARGSDKEADQAPGWFFVIEERVSESRFGLDTLAPENDLAEVITQWDSLSWGNFYRRGDDGNPALVLPESHYIDGTLPERIGAITGEAPANWPSDDIDGTSATIAWITHQKPMRVAIHADDMLP